MKKKPTQEIDIKGHFLIPPMEILSETEVKKVHGKYQIEKSQLPKVLLSDPSVHMLKAQIGDVIAIERHDAPAKYMAYRVVVEE